jgi:hypothetical protein
MFGFINVDNCLQEAVLFFNTWFSLISSIISLTVMGTKNPLLFDNSAPLNLIPAQLNAVYTFKFPLLRRVYTGPPV